MPWSNDPVADAHAWEASRSAYEDNCCDGSGCPLCEPGCDVCGCGPTEGLTGHLAVCSGCLEVVSMATTETEKRLTASEALTRLQKEHPTLTDFELWAVLVGCGHRSDEVGDLLNRQAEAAA